MSAEQAKSAAKGLLEAGLPRRWAHTQGVAARARSIAPALAEDAELVEVAAWLHDIGYAPVVRATEFHPLDGARYLRDVLEVDEVVCRLVAHHTGALIEAEERGIIELADEFPLPEQQLLEALTYCDMTADVDGRPVDVDERLGEILTRYPSDHVVHRSILRSRPALRAAAGNVLRRISRCTATARDCCSDRSVDAWTGPSAGR
ncbi:putative nucleotidyltransferase with HDIG domain [Kribbella antiqua]|uniref:Putative nucleotidyltransferase with HDIG domain n=1 Tax=Kribbella antiqua TaxID=2512217 RepID=A0A4R2I144_9ACTN|nr:HD domain-containing protein [Kribbella antiqua]TCO37632.1 putative nucleotidyltransferase with HDIG domain [Kribbella antiqua]